MVTESEIKQGLASIGLNSSSCAIVHSSLRSFGPVEGGAAAVCRALTATGATLLFPAAAWDLTAVPAPPGLVRPDNCALYASSWEEFDEALDRAVPFSDHLPVDKELGIIPETMRQSFQHIRSRHPLFSYLAVGNRAGELISAQSLDWPLGPLDVLDRLNGDVLLLGVSHTSNTAIHLAEQRLGRSHFYRYAKAADHVWMELPHIPGESHHFDEIKPHIEICSEVIVGSCLMQRIPIRSVLSAAQKLITANPAALLCDQPGCRCEGALNQRIKFVSEKR